MQPRKTQLFNANKAAPPANIIPATVKFEHDKKAGIIKQMNSQQKMLCALRKCLAKMSDSNPAGRYYIAGNKVELLSAPTTTAGKAGEPQSYRASGRCRVRQAHGAGHVTTLFIEFTISYRDKVDDRGLPDVEVMDPTTIDQLDRSTAINLRHLQ